MRQELERAIALRQAGRLQEANELLVRLAREFPDDPLISYHCAWSYDVMGEEAAAVPHYENAIRSGLSGTDLEGALLGLGSTCRTLGRYDLSRDTLLKGVERFPRNLAIRTFYAMTLYNLNDHAGAMKILLECLAETSADEEIQAYKRAILFYSDKLDEVWPSEK